MTSEEFHALVDEYSEESEEGGGDAPLTLAEIANLERQKGVKFPAFYKEFLSMYGAGEFGSVTVLSPDPRSSFAIWETSCEIKDWECNFMGVAEIDSNFYGFLIEQGVYSNDVWSADHDWAYEIGSTDYVDFFDFLAQVGLGIWNTEEEEDKEEDEAKE